VISFSVGREDLAGYHLKKDLVAEQYRPLPELLTDHLAQGILRYCLFPRRRCDNPSLLGTLDPVTEANGISPEDDELPDHDPADPASLTDRLHQLKLESGGGPSGTKGAYAQIEQFSMEEREYGEGKSAFESYLAASLSRNHIVPTLWGYTEDD
jgi:hypothetical protein